MAKKFAVRLGVVLGLALVLGGAAWAGRPPRRVSNSLGMEFVLIPAGRFLMGSPPTEPGRQPDETQHPVTISRPFYLQTTEVTLAQWWALMGKRLFGRRRGDPRCPVSKVSWFEAVEFARRLSRREGVRYRLPTEAEWEYACRAGTTTPYWWGDDIDCGRALYANNELKAPQCLEACRRRGLPVNGPAPVACFPPNPWGLYDTAGNLWEWCADWFGPYPKGPVRDPQGPPQGYWRVRRGGSWFGGPRLLRSANRNYANPAVRETTIGFRLVRELP